MRVTAPLPLILLLLASSTAAGAPLEDALPRLLESEPATDGLVAEAPAAPALALDGSVPDVSEASAPLSSADPAPALDVSLPLLGLRLAPGTPDLDLLAATPAQGADPPLLPYRLPWPGGPGGAADDEAREGADAATLERVDRPEPEGGEVGVSMRGPAAPPEHDRVASAVAIGATALLAALSRLYSRFERHDVLRNEARARIHALVVARPGATFADLARETGLRRGALVHHAQMLARHGLVSSRHDGLNRRFYPGGARVEPAPRPPTAAERRVLDLLAAQGPLTQGELAARLRVTPQAVSYHVLRLSRSGRVLADDSDAPRRWVAAAGARDGGQRPPVKGDSKTMTDIG